MEKVVIGSFHISTLAFGILGIGAMLIVLDHIRVQRCFVSIMWLKMSGLYLNLKDTIRGLDILTCYHMEEGKVPSSMAGSQDALLPILIGSQVNQTIPVRMKIMHMLFIIEVYGETGVLETKVFAAVSTIQL